MLFSGSYLKSGNAKILVLAVGVDAQIGKIANTLSQESNVTAPLSEKLAKLSKKISIFGGIAAGLTFLMAIGRLYLSNNLTFENLTLNGKYSFQYIENATFVNCNLNTKDAFWHGKNIIVKDSIVKGEYLAWYSENLTFINCKIIGTQPLCYCKNLKLIDCEMLDCDLSFENSEVNGNVLGYVESIKNPYKGIIQVGQLGQLIEDDEKYKCSGKVIISE